MRRRLLRILFCVCAVTGLPDGSFVTPASASVASRPEIIGQNRIRLFGNWRIRWERGDDNDFWLFVNQTGLPERRIHALRTLDIEIRDSDFTDGWTIDVVVKPDSNTDCGVTPSACPPAYIALNLLVDWTYRLRAEDDPTEINDTDMIFERLDRPGGSAPALFAVQMSSTTVHLSWSAFPGATAYQLEVGSAPGLSDLLVLPLGNITFLPATGPPGTYFVRLRAWWSGILTGPSNEEKITLGVCNLLPAPTLLQFTKTGSLVTLTWLGVANSNNTRLLVGSAPHLADFVNASIGSVPFFQADVSSIPAGTYYVRVAAENGCGPGTPSSAVAISVP